MSAEDAMAAAANAATAATMTAAEYSDSVYQWHSQLYNWHMAAMSFPSYLAYQAYLQASSASTGNNQNAFSNNSTPNVAAPATPANFPFLEFRVPKIWKRFAAELIDFIVLLLIKFSVTMLLIDTIDFDLDGFLGDYDSSSLGLGLSDYTSILDGLTSDDPTSFTPAANEAIEKNLESMRLFTSSLIMLELINRIIVCIFEALCTYRGPRGIPGGATPGKLFLGLRIFRVDEVRPGTTEERVKIRPAADLGIFWAVVRAVLKSVTVAFLFPVSIAFFFTPFNRTIYDVMSKSIVVEIDSDYMRRAMAQRQQQQQQQQQRRLR